MSDISQKEPAEGSRETVERQLEQQDERERKRVDHAPGVQAGGQSQGGVARPDDRGDGRS